MSDMLAPTVICASDAIATNEEQHEKWLQDLGYRYPYPTFARDAGAVLRSIAARAAPRAGTVQARSNERYGGDGARPAQLCLPGRCKLQSHAGQVGAGIGAPEPRLLRSTIRQLGRDRLR